MRRGSCTKWSAYVEAHIPKEAVRAAMWQAGLFDSSIHARSSLVHVFGIFEIIKYRCHRSRTHGRTRTCYLSLIMLLVAYHMLCIFGMHKSFKARVHSICTISQESNLLPLPRRQGRQKIIPQKTSNE